jgi:hypothetical protein
VPVVVGGLDAYSGDFVGVGGVIVFLSDSPSPVDRIAGPFRAYGSAKAFPRIVGASDWWIHPQTFTVQGVPVVNTYWVAYALPSQLLLA